MADGHQHTIAQRCFIPVAWLGRSPASALLEQCSNALTAGQSVRPAGRTAPLSEASLQTCASGRTFRNRRGVARLAACVDAPVASYALISFKGAPINMPPGSVPVRAQPQVEGLCVCLRNQCDGCFVSAEPQASQRHLSVRPRGLSRRLEEQGHRDPNSRSSGCRCRTSFRPRRFCLGVVLIGSSLLETLGRRASRSCMPHPVVCRGLPGRAVAGLQGHRDRPAEPQPANIACPSVRADRAVRRVKEPIVATFKMSHKSRGGSAIRVAPDSSARLTSYKDGAVARSTKRRTGFGIEGAATNGYPVGQVMHCRVKSWREPTMSAPRLAAVVVDRKFAASSWSTCGSKHPNRPGTNHPPLNASRLVSSGCNKPRL
jgi:hypothetical protein